MSAPPAPAPDRARGTALGNVHPALRRCWHPVARSPEVTGVPRRVWLLGEPWVVVRLEGRPTVLADRCPHRLAPLSAGTVVDGTLACAYHGWRFDAEGGCVSVPSAGGPGTPVPPRSRAGAPWGVVERFGLVLVALEEPVVPLPELPEVEAFDVDRWSDPDCRYVEMGPYEGPYGAGQLIDNQLDASHFAFLHRGTFGSAEARQLAPYEVVREPWGFAVDLAVPITAGNDPGTAAGHRPLQQERSMRYRFQVPFHLVLHLDYPVMGGTSTILFWVQPQAEDRARMYVTVRLWQPGGFTDAELAARMAFEERVVGEDLALQARFDDRSLPLDPTVECHVRADRASVEYRRLLRALVAEAGVASADRDVPAVPAPAAPSRRPTPVTAGAER